MIVLVISCTSTICCCRIRTIQERGDRQVTAGSEHCSINWLKSAACEPVVAADFYVADVCALVDVAAEVEIALFVATNETGIELPADSQAVRSALDPGDPQDLDGAVVGVEGPTRVTTENAPILVFCPVHRGIEALPDRLSVGDIVALSDQPLDDLIGHLVLPVAVGRRLLRIVLGR